MGCDAASVLLQEAGVSHFSLVTAQGANKNMWANDWGIFHGLLYIKVCQLASIGFCISRLVRWHPCTSQHVVTLFFLRETTNSFMSINSCHSQVKGLAEHAVRAQEFRSATIVRPGVMDRGPGRRLEM